MQENPHFSAGPFAQARDQPIALAPPPHCFEAARLGQILQTVRRKIPDVSGWTESSETRLLRPQVAFRTRWNTNTDTPLPPDEPAGENPPPGAMFDYSLGADASGPVTLEIEDAKGNLVRRFASTDPTPTPDPKLKIPRYWLRPPQVLSAEPGLHRFLWDLHGQPLPEVESQYPMTAVEHETAPQPTAPWVLPGEYRVSLTSGGKTFTAPLTVKLDPRVKATSAELAQQFAASMKLVELRRQLEPIGKSYDKVVSQLNKLSENAAKKSAPLRTKLEALADPARVRAGETLELDLLNKTRKLFNDLQQVDSAPTSRQQKAVSDLERETPAALAKWKAVEAEIVALNSQLGAVGLEPIKLPNEKEEER